MASDQDVSPAPRRRLALSVDPAYRSHIEPYTECPAVVVVVAPKPATKKRERRGLVVVAPAPKAPFFYSAEKQVEVRGVDARVLQLRFRGAGQDPEVGSGGRRAVEPDVAGAGTRLEFAGHVCGSDASAAHRQSFSVAILP